MNRALLVAIIVLLCLGSATADSFDFSTPERTWATFKFSLDTKDWALFKRCLLPAETESMDEDQFHKFLSGDGRFAQTSRVVDTTIKGKEAVLSIDFYCRERDGRLLVDNDPIRLVKVKGKWLIEGI